MQPDYTAEAVKDFLQKLWEENRLIRGPALAVMEWIKLSSKDTEQGR